MENEKVTECGCGCEEKGGCDTNKSQCGCENDHEHKSDEACGCGCGDHESLIVDLEDDNGNIVQCEVVDGFIYNEIEYALVQNPEDDSVYLFKVVGEGDDGELVVPEDKEFEEATAYYESTLEAEE